MPQTLWWLPRRAYAIVTGAPKTFASVASNIAISTCALWLFFHGHKVHSLFRWINRHRRIDPQEMYQRALAEHQDILLHHYPAHCLNDGIVGVVITLADRYVRNSTMKHIWKCHFLKQASHEKPQFFHCTGQKFSANTSACLSIFINIFFIVIILRSRTTLSLPWLINCNRATSIHIGDKCGYHHHDPAAQL